MSKNFLRISISIALLFILTLSLSKFAQWNIESNVPDVIHEAINHARTSTAVQNKIGEVLSDESSFNVHDLDGDSINYLITLTGDKARMSIRTHAKRMEDNKWHIDSSDTLITKY